VITFILLIVFFLLALMFSAVAYSSAARRRSGVHPDYPEIPVSQRNRVPDRN